MNEIFFINTFFNIVYRNELAYMRDFLMSYDYLQSFIQWLNQRHISCPVLESITKDEYALLSYLMKVEDVDHILHIPFSVEMETIAQTYEKAIHIVYVFLHMKTSIFMRFLLIFKKTIYHFSILFLLSSVL